MAKIQVRNLGQDIDGDYELVAIDDWMRDEWYKIKKLTGLVIGDFLAADEAGRFDLDMLFSLAVVSCDRAGKPRPELLLGRAKLGDILLEQDEADEAKEDEEEDDPAAPPQPEPEPEPAASPENGSGTGRSGMTTTPSSDAQETTLRAVGGLT